MEKKAFSLVGRILLFGLVVILAMLLVAVTHYLRSGAGRPAAVEYRPHRVYPVAALQRDFQVLYTTLREAHGHLYAHQQPVAFRNLARRVHDRLNHAMTEAEFFCELAPLVAAVGCGHTVLSPSRGFTDRLNRTSSSMPYALCLRDGRLWFTPGPRSEENDLRGWEVVSINGQQTAALIRRILGGMSGDGAIATRKRRLLEKHLPRYLTLYLGVCMAYRLHVRAPDGRKKWVVVQALKGAEAERTKRLRTRQDTAPPATFQVFPGERGAVLRLRTFYTVDLERAGIRYRKFFASVFRRLAELKVANLVIDLRGNAGGSMRLATDLLAYLHREEFNVSRCYRMSSCLTLTWKRYVRRNLLQAFKTMVTLPRNGYRVYPWYGPLRAQTPKKRLRFTGRLYLLVDGETFSAAAMFAALARDRGNAVVLGEETGGAARGGGVAPIRLTLPETRLRAEIPLGYLTLAVSEKFRPHRGVMPDYTVVPGTAAYGPGHDQLMEFARAMIGPRVPVHANLLSENVLFIQTGASPVMSNAVAVSTGKGVVLIDAHYSPGWGEKIRSLVRSTFPGEKVAYLVYSHAGVDHMGGAAAFPHAVVVGHEACVESINDLHRSLDSIDIRRAMHPRLQRIWQGIENPEKEPARLVKRREAFLYWSNLSELLATGFRYTKPHITFADRMGLSLGKSRLELVYCTPGYSKSDVLIHLPREKMLLLGDIFLPHRVPLLNRESDLKRWREVFRPFLEGEIEIRHILGCHGNPITLDQIHAQLDYLADLWESVGKARRQGLSLAEIQARYALERRYPHLCHLNTRWEGTPFDLHERNVKQAWTGHGGDTGE